MKYANAVKHGELVRAENLEMQLQSCTGWAPPKAVTLFELGGVVIGRAHAGKANFLHQRDLLGRRLVRRVLCAGIHRKKRIRQFDRAGFNAAKRECQDDAGKRPFPGKDKF